MWSLMSAKPTNRVWQIINLCWLNLNKLKLNMWKITCQAMILPKSRRRKMSNKRSTLRNLLKERMRLFIIMKIVKILKLLNLNLHRRWQSQSNLKTLKVNLQRSYPLRMRGPSIMIMSSAPLLMKMRRRIWWWANPKTITILRRTSMREKMMSNKISGRVKSQQQRMILKKALKRKAVPYPHTGLSFRPQSLIPPWSLNTERDFSKPWSFSIFKR